MPDPEPPKRTVQMYERPASADRSSSPIGRLALIAVALIVVALVAAKFIFHVHYGHLLPTGH